MNGQKEMVIQAAIAFNDAWTGHSLTDREVWEAANALASAVRKLIRERRKAARVGEDRK